MKKSIDCLFIVAFIIFIFFLSCKKEKPCEGCPTNPPPGTTNKQPFAVAGPDRTITLSLDSISLDGSASSDPDGTISSYLWTKISGPASFNLVNATASKTVVKNLVAGTYQFELIVTDNKGLAAKDNMEVIVYDSVVNTQQCESRPVINAQLIPVGTLSVGRAGPYAATAGNKILFAGGYLNSGGNTSYLTRVDIYDFVSNTWSTAELTESRKDGMGTASVGSKILFAGGKGLMNDLTDGVDMYDASNNTWSATHLSQARFGIAAATLGNKIFFAGGSYYDQNRYFNSAKVDIYDNATNTWAITTLSIGKFAPAATVAGNKLYVAGGSTESFFGQSISNSIDIFDASSNSWSAATLQEPRIGMASIASGNKIYWAGGFNSYDLWRHSNTIESRDLQTGATSLICMNARTGSKAVIRNDKIIFFTGYSNDARSGTHFEIYSTATNTWSTGVLDRRLLDAAIISVNNVVYVAGGTDGANNFYNQVWKLEF